VASDNRCVTDRCVSTIDDVADSGTAASLNKSEILLFGRLLGVAEIDLKTMDLADAGERNTFVNEGYGSMHAIEDLTGPL
jgi:hypothetical protein